MINKYLSYSNMKNQHVNKTDYNKIQQNIISILLITVFISFILSSQQALASDRIVLILNNSSNPLAKQFYEPESISVKTGEEITWVNSDELMHTVTEGSTSEGPQTSGFDSGILHSGQEYKHSFYKPGEYYYHCNFHPFMIGNISVTSPN